MPDPERQTSRASDFRYIATDAVGFQFSEHSVKLIFGIEDMAGAGLVIEQMGAVLNLPSAKLLLLMLSESIKRYEAATGRVVQLDPEKVAGVMKVFDDSDVQRSMVQEQPS